MPVEKISVVIFLYVKRNKIVVKDLCFIFYLRRKLPFHERSSVITTIFKGLYKNPYFVTPILNGFIPLIKVWDIVCVC